VRVFSAALGSLSTLAASTKSDWIFVLFEGERMERLAIQCARETNVHVVVVGKLFLNASEWKVVKYLADVIQERSTKGSDFGVVVISDDMRHLMPNLPTERSLHDYLREKVSKELNRRAFLGNTKAMFSCRLFELHMPLALGSVPHCSDDSFGRYCGALAADFLSQADADVPFLLIVDNQHLCWRPFAVNLSEGFPAKLPLDELTDLVPPSQRRFINVGPMQIYSTEDLSGPVPPSHLGQLTKLHKLLYKLQVMGDSSTGRAEAVAALVNSAKELLLCVENRD
jgi:hypothetical protein